MPEKSVTETPANATHRADRGEWETQRKAKPQSSPAKSRSDPLRGHIYRGGAVEAIPGEPDYGA